MVSRILYSPREQKKIKRPRLRLPGLKPKSIFLSLILFGGLGYVLQMPSVVLSKIEIQGAEYLDPAALEENIDSELNGKYAFLFPKRSFFLYTSNQIKSSLLGAFPRIGEIQIQKKFPDGLFVSVKERKPWGILCQKDNFPAGAETATSTQKNDLPAAIEPVCVFIDNTGFAIEDAPQSHGSLILKVEGVFPELSPGTQVLEQSLVSQMIFLEEKIKKAIDGKVIGFEFSGKNSKEIRANVSDGYALIFLKGDNFENQLAVLKRILESEIKDRRRKLLYVDLRFGNKVFYKYK